jgi:ADP-ribosylglycohydrolase
MICFLESKDYVDCIKLAISLGGDSDTLAAIAGPMAYAYYKTMPDALVYQAMKMLPDWMVDVSERFDKIVNGEK